MTKKKITLIIALILVTTLATYCLYAFFAPVSLTFDVLDKAQTIKGFGASSAWTSQVFGIIDDEEMIDDAIEKIYGSDGLSLNIYRYNIGAGSADSALDGLVPYSNHWHQRERRAESFFVAEKFSDKNSFDDIDNYDFSRDEGARNMFDKALMTGNIEHVVFFANSPHYLMTESGLATGAYEYQNNLKEDYYEAYSNYLLLIVNYFYENTLSNLENVPSIYISPINEPQWRWGGESASQEGCHFDPEPLAAFLDVFINKVNDFNHINGTNFKADVFDSGNYVFNTTTKYLKEMAKYDYFNDLEQISVHSYKANESLFYRYLFALRMSYKYPDLSLSMTEFCEMEHGRDESIDSGLFTGKVMLRDLAILNVTDWSWWLALSSGDYNDGLVYWIDNELTMLKRYYVMGHFSKYIDKGDIRIKVKSNDIFNLSTLDKIAFLKPDGKIVLIVINSGKAQTVKIDKRYNIIQTITTNKDKNWHISSEQSNTISFEANSIKTIIIDS